MRILFNMPGAGLHGGLATCVPPLRDGVTPYVQVITFQHGGAANAESLAWKCLRTGGSLAVAECKILRERPDLIHVNSAFDKRSILRDTPLAVLAARHRIPLVLMVHGSFPEVIRPVGGVVERAKRILVRNLSMLCVLSSAEKDEFEHHLPELRGRVCVMKNVIADRFFATERHESQDPLVLFASRFVKKKGPFELLEAVPTVRACVANARFVFLGDGPDAASFDEQVRSRHLTGVVQRFPYVSRDEMAEWYSRAWVLVFPTSFAEGMPMVVAEGMATGVPIVTTRTRFSRSYTVDGEHCLYCEPRNPELLAQQVITLLTDRTLRDKMSHANRSFAQTFRQDIVAREFVSLYEQLCAPTRQLTGVLHNDSVATTAEVAE